MIWGGIPYYWEQLQRGLSLSQNIDLLFFSEDAPLKHEYRYLYASIFKNPTVHMKIVETLGKKKSGMTREEIIENAKLINSGDLTVKLEELESSGFIRKYNAFGMKKRNAVYQLIDCFTLFYFKFMTQESNDVHFWSNQIHTPTVNTWMGLAFERVCMLHIEQIKKKLGISGVLTEVNSWYIRADDEKGISGSQIDLLIVRRDQVINLCEMKYAAVEYKIDKNTYMDIQRKINDFSLATGTRYSIHPTLVTSYALMENAYSDIIQSTVTMEDLFE